MKNLLSPDPMEIAENMVDLTAPRVGVEVVIDWKRKVIHVNADGACILRICRIPEILYNPISPVIIEPKDENV